ncbi:MAG TPA: nucleoside-diphosphate kinase [Planctomycetes bacterium]|nr:nucleoside-diphosphate kinase [Planctomycetota bacterium]HIN80447.1 nucleoside-diphosphate kinase [Planctomycetota bacterium]
MERTLILLKPDAVQRRLIGSITSRFERKGLKVLAMKMMQISPELAAQHYDAHHGKPFYDGLVQFMTSGPVVALALEGNKAISVCRKLMGATFGCDAEAGTIRGDFGISDGFNLVHGSDSAETASRELELFFSPEEMIDYSLIDDSFNAAE